MSAETAAEPRVYSHFGWINAGVSSPRRFLLGRTLFDQESSCDVVLDRALEERAPEFDLGGYPLDDWKQPAAMLFAKGCEAQSLMLLGSFAAPLMRLWPWDAGRNAMISLHGGANSGRNTALIAAQSVWGAPDATRITRLSTVSFEALSNLPVTTEILAQRDPSIIAAGLGKFVTGPWATLLLSSSAVPINGIIDDPVPGIELRCAVPRALIRPKDADRIKERLLASRGHAGRAFIRHLIKRGVLNNARMAMESELAELVERSGLIEPRPWLRALAACHVAGTLGRDIGLLEYEPRRITDWTLKEMLK